MIDLAFAIVYWAVLFTAGAMVAVVFVAVCLTFKNLMGARPPVSTRAPHSVPADSVAPLPGRSAQLVYLEYERARRRSRGDAA